MEKKEVRVGSGEGGEQKKIIKEKKTEMNVPDLVISCSNSIAFVSMFYDRCSS